MTDISKRLHYLDSSTLHEIAWDLDLAQTEEGNASADREMIGKLLEQVNTRCSEINAARRTLAADIPDSTNIPELLEAILRVLPLADLEETMAEWRRTVPPPRAPR